jgi:uncharacterized ion transporter superfamily protein YfcC
MAGLPAFFFLSLVGQAEEGEKGSPAAGVSCFLVDFGGILLILMKCSITPNKMQTVTSHAVTGQKKKLIQILAW